MISTGAVVPAGADAVVPVERTSGEVTVEGVAAGDNVRPRGGDARAGDVVVTAGSRARAARRSRRSPRPVWPCVRCARRPRVAVLATGSELRAPGEPLAPGRDLRVELRPASPRSSRRSGVEATVLPRRGGRRGRDPRGARARARARRAHHVRRRVGRPARSRARDARRARRGGGVLARRGQARQADRLRGARRHARLRAARQPRLVARRVRAVRPARRCARCRGRATPGPDFLPGRLARAVRRTRASGTSSRARAATAIGSSRSADRTRT